MGLFSNFKVLKDKPIGDGLYFAQIKKTGEYAVYNSKTKTLGVDRFGGFEEIQIYGKSCWAVQETEKGNTHKKYAFLGSDGILKTGFIFTSFSHDEPAHCAYFPVEMADGSGYTFMDKNYNVMEKRFKSVGPIRCGMRTVSTKEGETYFQESTGKLMRLRCKKVFDFHNDMGIIQTVKGFTYVNLQGKVLPIRVEMAGEFENDGCAIVKNGQYFTLVNTSGVLTEGEFSVILPPTDSFSTRGNGPERFRQCYINNSDYVIAENGYIPVEEWFKLVDNNSENFQYLPYQKFRDSAFVKKCREIVISKLYKKATGTLNEDDINQAQKLLDMLDKKEETAKEQIRLEDERIAEEARKKAELEQAKLQDKSERQKAMAIAAARRNAEEEKAKREAEEERRRKAEERASAEESERAKQEEYKAQMFSMLKKTNNKDKAD